MKKYYLLLVVATCMLANRLPAQCGLSLSTSASTVCVGGNVTLTATATPPLNAATLPTTMAAGNNHRGNMFDISATNTVIIDSFDASPMGNTTIEIYYRAGSYVGNESSSSGWTLAGSAAVIAQVSPTPTPVPINVHVTIPAGQTYAFYVTSSNTSVSLNYTNGTAAGNAFASDANITFHEGVGLEYPFTAGTSATYSPRVWNGVIHYSIPIVATTTYLWNTTETTQSISPVINNDTSFSVQADVTGCSTMYDTIQVHVSIPPVSAGNDTLVCESSNVVLSGSGAVSYTWDNSVTDGVAFTPAATGSYVVTGTDSIGCTATDTVMVTVNKQLLGLSISPSANTVCAGNQATLTANAAQVGGPASLTTTFAAGNGHRGNMFDIVATNTVVIDSFDAHPEGNTTIEIYYRPGSYVGHESSSAGWTLVGSAAVIAQPQGTPTPVPVDINVTIPAGQTYGFYVTSTNTSVSLNYTNGTGVGNVFASDANISFLEGAGFEYPFTNGGGINTPRVWNGIIHYTVPGSSSVSYLWSTTETTNPINPTVSVDSQFVVQASVAGCAPLSDSITITVSHPVVSAGADTAVCTGASVILSGAGAVSYTWDNSVTNGVAFSPANTGGYVVTGTDSIGCTATDTVMVTVNSLPVVSAGVDTAVCAGSSVTLMGSGAVSYVWDNSVTDGVAFNPSSTADYAVIGTDANGCVGTDTVTVSINSAPAVSAGADTAVCAGSSVILMGSGAVSYTWNNSVTDGVAFSPTSAAEYIVAGTDANGCVGTDTVTVSINSAPAVSAGADTAVCAGSSVMLMGSGAVSYIWNNSVTDGVAFSPSSTADYVVMGTGANGCVGMDTVTVTVNSAPAVNAGADASICAGASTTLSGSGASTYVWNNSVTDGVAFTPASTATYVVTGTDANGCMGIDTVVITVNTVDVTTTVQNETVTANATGASYQWLNCGGSSISGQTNQSYTATVTGSYAVVVTQNGCVDTSACQSVTVLGISNVANGFQLSVYPNPTNGQIFITTGNVADEILLTDIDGRIIESIKPDNTQVIFNLAKYAAGMYLVRITINGTERTAKLVKE